MLKALIAACLVGGFVPTISIALQPEVGAREAQRLSTVPTFIVSIAPLRSLVEPFAEVLAMEAAASERERKKAVEVLIPPGVSEHGYEIAPAKLAAMMRADVIIYVGFGLEPQVVDFVSEHANPRRDVIVLEEIVKSIEGDPTSGEPSEPVKSDDAQAHAEPHVHGPDCDHEHDQHIHHGVDPHVWLDPVLMKAFVPRIHEGARQAAIRRGLMDEECETRLKAAADSLTARIDAMDAKYRAELAREGERRPMVVAHDAWCRLAERYGIETVALAGLTAREPSPRAIEEAIKSVRERGARVIFTEPQIDARPAKRVSQATKVPLKTIDPLGSGDWFAMMEENLKQISRAVKPGE
jgi:zinc transport system substrate-binding protein